MTAPAAALLEAVAGHLREGHAAEAGRLLKAGLADGAAAEAFGLFAAAVLLDQPVPPTPPAVDPGALAPLLREHGRIALDRLAEAILRIAAAPADESPRIEAACLLLEAGEPHLAEQAMRPGWHRSAGPLFCRVVSGIWAVLDRREPALEAARRAADAAPGIAEYHLHHAGLLLQGDEPGAALLAAGRAIGLRAEEAVAWRQASAALLALGHTAPAIEASRRAAALSHDQRDFAEEVLVSAGAEALGAPTGPEGAHPADGAAPGADWRPAPANWPAWARPPEQVPPLSNPGLRQALAAKVRVMDALMLRETRTFFTHSKLGYAWALFEPLTHVFVLTVAMSFLGGSHTPLIGESMAIFYMTGVLPYLFFCHLTEKGMDLARSQHVVLTLPNLDLSDVMGASLLLRAATDTVVFIVSLGVFAALGIGGLPRDPVSLALAYIMLFLLGSGIAALNLALSTLSSVPEKIWPVALRAFYFLSGIFYHPDMMPTEFREYVLWNPLVHVIEWVRQSYFPLYVSPYLDVTYLFRCTVLALLLGTLAAAGASRRARLLH